ncbi:phage major capsid protein, partial [Sulfitobacter sp. HI0129]
MSAEQTGISRSQSAPVREMEEAVAGFLSDMKGFRAEIETRVKRSEERMTMMDQKMTAPARSPLSGRVDSGAPHQKAFNAYLRNGDDDGLRGLELEGKSLSTAVNSDGGYLVDPQTAERVQSVLNATASIRAIASVVRVEATSYDVLVDHTDVGAGWATEAGPVAETDTPQIDRITIPLHEL